MWPYRDWVIKAFNRNLPFDQFVTWQLAGDLLPNATKEQRLATAFNRLHMQNEEGGIVEEEFRVAYVVDRVNTIGTAFLGPDVRVHAAATTTSTTRSRRRTSTRCSRSSRTSTSRGQTSYFTDADAGADAAALAPTSRTRSSPSCERRSRRRTKQLRPTRRAEAGEAFDDVAGSRAAKLPGMPGPGRGVQLRRRSRTDQVANAADPKQPGKAARGPEARRRQGRQGGRARRRERLHLPRRRPLHARRPVLAGLWLQTPAHAAAGRGRPPQPGPDRRRQPRVRAAARGRPRRVRPAPHVAGQLAEGRHEGRDRRSTTGRTSPSPTTARAGPRACGSTSTATPAELEVVRDGLYEGHHLRRRRAGPGDRLPLPRQRVQGRHGRRVPRLQPRADAAGGRPPRRAATISRRLGEPSERCDASATRCSTTSSPPRTSRRASWRSELHAPARRSRPSFVNPIPEVDGDAGDADAEAGVRPEARRLRRAGRAGDGRHAGRRCRRSRRTSRGTGSGWRGGCSTRDHPLTARVTVNRALAADVRPRHRRDERQLRHARARRRRTRSCSTGWPASSSTTCGWDVKRLLKTIALSATYRQSSQRDAGAARARPGQPAARPRPGAAADRRDAPRPGAVRQRAARREARRAERQAVPAGRAVGRRDGPAAVRPGQGRRTCTAAACTRSGSGPSRRRR